MELIQQQNLIVDESGGRRERKVVTDMRLEQDMANIPLKKEPA